MKFLVYLFICLPPQGYEMGGTFPYYKFYLNWPFPDFKAEGAH